MLKTMILMAGSWLGVAMMVHSEEKEVKTVVQQFIAGGDHQSVDELEPLLHAQFRVIWNNTAEAKVSPLDRAAYLDLIGKKVIGGDSRKLTVERVVIHKGVNATVLAKSVGEKATFYHSFGLVNTAAGWQLVADLMYMEAK